MEKINWRDFHGAENPILDAYRVLRTNMLCVANNKKLLEFTSPVKDTENSAVVAGIAIVFAQAGYKTLLIDGNFANPSQHILFELAKPGIGEALGSNADLFNMIHHCTQLDRLDILT